MNMSWWSVSESASQHRHQHDDDGGEQHGNNGDGVQRVGFLPANGRRSNTRLRGNRGAELLDQQAHHLAEAGAGGFG